MKKKIGKKLLLAATIVAMEAYSVSTIFAATSYTYTPPAQPMVVNDNIITATSHRAASPLTDMLGMNTTSGFGMTHNGAAPSSLEDAKTEAALGIWGSNLNESPDPYYWNYFYNFYADANNLPTTKNALINDNVASSPAWEDSTLKTEYGNISTSLSTRPDVVLGTDSKPGEPEANGYASQLDTIHHFTPDSEYYKKGDENYQPQLVSYQYTRLTDMVSTVKRLAKAMDQVTKETGKVGRYGEPDVIASDYEKYIYATSAYIKSEITSGKIKEKTVAIVNKANEDGTYTLSGPQSMRETSSVRQVEYLSLVTNNLIDKLGNLPSDGSGNYIATAAQLAAADTIVSTGNNANGLTISDLTTALTGAGIQVDDIPMMVTTQPNTLYGITMNSIENAMGLGYYIGYVYSDVMDINPIDMSAYFYQKFWHITNLNSLGEVVKNNFAETVLPKGMDNTLSADYSMNKIETMLSKGLAYYEKNPDDFKDTYIADQGFAVDWNSGIGSNYVKDDGSESSNEQNNNNTPEPGISNANNDIEETQADPNSDVTEGETEPANGATSVTSVATGDSYPITFYMSLLLLTGTIGMAGYRKIHQKS